LFYATALLKLRTRDVSASIKVALQLALIAFIRLARKLAIP